MTRKKTSWYYNNCHATHRETTDVCDGWIGFGTGTGARDAIPCFAGEVEHHAFLEGFAASPVMNAHQNRNMRNMHLKLIKVSRIVKKHGLITAANATKINKNHSSALQAINSLARLRGALAGRVAALTGRRR